MTATYGAIGRTDYGVRVNTLAPVPAGTANGDLLILVAVTGNATQVAVSLPAGFTQIGSAQSGADGSGFDWYAVMGYRIASSEPANYTCTHASAGCETMMVRVDGAGTLSVDVFSQAVHVGDTGTSTATSVTPTEADDLLLFVSLNWDEAALTPPTGMTERQDAQFIYLATQALASSSATGTRTQTHSNSPWFANLIAIKDAGAGGTTLTADAGSYTISGAGAGILGKAVADPGSYALTGYVATSALGQTAGGGSYALSGTTAAFAYKQTVAAGAYTLTGSAAGLNVTANLVFPATAGAYSLTGSDAALTIASASFTLFCGSGSYALTGSDVSFPGYDPAPPVQPSTGSGYVGAWSGPKRRKRKRDEIEELIDAVIAQPAQQIQQIQQIQQPPPPALIDMTAKMQAVGLTPPQRRTVKRAIVSDDEDDDEEAIELLLNLLS